MLECCNCQHSYCEHCLINGANNISNYNTNCSAAGYGSDTNNMLECCNCQHNCREHCLRNGANNISNYTSNCSAVG